MHELGEGCKQSTEGHRVDRDRISKVLSYSIISVNRV